MFKYIHSSFPDRKRSPEYPIFSEMKSSLKLVAVFELFGRPALDFPGRLGRHWTRFGLRTLRRRGHHWTRLHLWTLQRRGWLSLNCSTGLQLSGLEFFSLSIQLTLRSAVFLRHTTFQAFYMHFGPVNRLHHWWRCALESKKIQTTLSYKK